MFIILSLNQKNHSTEITPPMCAAAPEGITPSGTRGTENKPDDEDNPAYDGCVAGNDGGGEECAKEDNSRLFLCAISSTSIGSPSGRAFCEPWLIAPGLAQYLADASKLLNLSSAPRKSFFIGFSLP